MTSLDEPDYEHRTLAEDFLLNLFLVLVAKAKKLGKIPSDVELTKHSGRFASWQRISVHTSGFVRLTGRLLGSDRDLSVHVGGLRIDARFAEPDLVELFEGTTDLSHGAGMTYDISDPDQAREVRRRFLVRVIEVFNRAQLLQEPKSAPTRIRLGGQRSPQRTARRLNHTTRNGRLTAEARRAKVARRAERRRLRAMLPAHRR